MIAVNLRAIESREDDILRVDQVQRDLKGLVADRAGPDLEQEVVQVTEDQENTGLLRTK